MLIARRLGIADRACAALEDTRSINFQIVMDLSPAAAWMLARMEADRGGVDGQDFPYDTLVQNLPFFRKSDLVSRLTKQIHEAIGLDSTFTENGMIRLTPLGRMRIRKAMGEPIL